MRFTVVIPCYNSASTIGVALDSLVAQTERDFEVVIVDDASQDREALRVAIEHYRQHMPIRLFENARNMNGAYSRNIGIDAAAGEYIAFLDADDAWVPGRLDSAWRTIGERTGRRFAIYGQFELIRDRATGPILPRRGIRASEPVSGYVFAAGQLMQTSTFVCPAALAREVRFDEALQRHQDSDFMMRLQQSGAALVFQHGKCATYHFNSTDLRRRVAAGRINSAYCQRWLESKAAYLSPAARAGYNISVYARILYLEGRGAEARRLVMASLGSIGVRNLAELSATKLYTVFRARFFS